MLAWGTDFLCILFELLDSPRAGKLHTISAVRGILPHVYSVSSQPRRVLRTFARSADSFVREFRPRRWQQADMAVRAPLVAGSPRRVFLNPRSADFRPIAMFALLGLCLTACAPKRDTLSSEQRLAIYERANVQFANAVLFKPAETGPTNTMGFRLAPLLLQEVVSTNQGVATPTVYFEEGKVQLNGTPHDQVTYVWNSLAFASAKSAAPTVQGIRITLNASGSPVIWELLADDSGGELIFVSQSLEATALKTFGPPLVGRRYAVESSLENAPNAIVARVIEDGPVPMGPIVHLNAGSHNVSTLICRCMPTQARNLLASATYKLRPLAELNVRPAFDKPGQEAGSRLTWVLRLPTF